MLLEQLANYGAQETKKALPSLVIHHAKRAVLDWLAALYPGTEMAPYPQLIRAHASELGAGKSRLPGLNKTAFPATAAWINGSASHAVELDDIFKNAIYHPGCPVIAAALAVADELNVSGDAFLKAIVVGYEISTRIGTAVQPSHYRYFHTTGTVGCIGAAAAVAALAAPADKKVMLHALATATTFASGLQQAFRSDAMTKALHAGNAAAVGVRAGLGAAEGLIGAPDILEGEAGFGNAMASAPKWEAATHALGEVYNITLMTQKIHACCGHTFAAIDAAIQLKLDHRFSHADIAAITVTTYRAAIDVTGNFHPTTAFEAKFSLPYVVSQALVHDSVGLCAFTPDKLIDSNTRSLIRLLSLNEDSEMSSMFPSRRSARVHITLKSGRQIEHLSPYRRGDPESPLSDTELGEKFDGLVIPALGMEKANKLKEQVWNLDKLSVSELELNR